MTDMIVAPKFVTLTVKLPFLSSKTPTVFLVSAALDAPNRAKAKRHKKNKNFDLIIAIVNGLREKNREKNNGSIAR